MDRTEVVITNIKMPFWSMVRFMIKWSIATIPAIIILYLVALIFIGSVMLLIGF